MTSVVVAGALAAKPRNGGEAWVRLSWALGLERLGVEVTFVEELDNPNDAAVAWFEEVVRWAGLTRQAALVDASGMALAGIAAADVRDRADRADLLVNLSGNLRNEDLRRRFSRAAYVDLDPGYTQIWNLQGLEAGLGGHDVYFTVGLGVGMPGCRLPDDGIRWHALPPPVVLDHWPVSQARDPGRFTTVASWRGAYGPIVYGGERLGVKAHAFRRIARLPRVAPGDFEIALAIDEADTRDRMLLSADGWRLADPVAAAGTPEAFRSYVASSGAEFSATQGIYVETACGWFSDRTAKYLASGKPALVEDTGLGRAMPTGVGLLTFRTLDEAAVGVRRILEDYDSHCRAARALALEQLDSDRVLTHFLEEAL